MAKLDSHVCNVLQSFLYMCLFKISELISQFYSKTSIPYQLSHFLHLMSLILKCIDRIWCYRDACFYHNKNVLLYYMKHMYAQNHRLVLVGRGHKDHLAPTTLHSANVQYMKYINCDTPQTKRAGTGRKKTPKPKIRLNSIFQYFLLRISIKMHGF